MAISSSPFSWSLLSPSSSYTSSPSLYFLSPLSKSRSSNFFKTLNFNVYCSNQIDTQQINPTKKKRKPRPSFVDQIHDKWSVKTISQREKFPWQEQQEKIEQIEEEEEKYKRKDTHQSYGILATESENGNNNLTVSDSVSFGSKNRVILAPWVQKKESTKTQFDFEGRNSQKTETVSCISVHDQKKMEKGISKIDESPKKEISPTKSLKLDEEIYNVEDLSDEFDSMDFAMEGKSDLKSVEGEELKHRLPWEKVKSDDRDRLKAETLIPEFELKRLRNIALRMLERIKVGSAGITEALVKSIHEKWKESEVVKLKFEGPSSINMKRTHEILENRTGGLVIWRSGSSVVLYRGMTYNLQCVQSYSQETEPSTESSQSSKDLAVDFNVRKESMKTSKDLSEEEFTDISELNQLLDELGPRFRDWAGREPVPVDADLLPPVVKGYKRPFRLLPYGTRKNLRDKEMTYFRRNARTMPPHFALGRNRELEGLATAMVKLWGKSAIAKIAIKRGVQNTSNERMAEELKRLTGGTLVSRNKEYIVFYRGNDFLPPGVTNKLVEAKKEAAALRQDEEERARQIGLTLMDSKVNAGNGRLVAGTLAETLAATSRWANEPSSEEREKMMREKALANQASLVRYLEKKLTLAKGKVKKAESALRKVQEKLEPSDLPTDLETLTDEERFLFRKIGLSMKPFLLLGRRGVFDGTVENMHLHWKYRELVKIIVDDGKRFALVKHIAISLEAESGGILVSLDKTTKGYAIIIYRGKNYERPRGIRPKNLLTKRQALARSIELQRREALKHHIWQLEERMEKLKSELEEMKSMEEIDEQTLYSRIDNASNDDDDDEYCRSKMEEDEEEDEEAYLETYDSGNEE